MGLHETVRECNLILGFVSSPPDGMRSHPLQTDRHRILYRHRDRDRDRDRETERQTERQTDRERDRERGRQTD